MEMRKTAIYHIQALDLRDFTQIKLRKITILSSHAFEHSEHAIPSPQFCIGIPLGLKPALFGLAVLTESATAHLAVLFVYPIL